MKTAGVTDRLLKILQKAGLDPRLYDGLSAEPEHTEVQAAGDLVREFRAEAVVGLGGGSALDGAKAVAVAATHPNPIMNYVGITANAIGPATLPILAITSTSGTGSHMGRIAVLSDRARKIKRSLVSDHLYPRAAFCDPDVLATMPPEVTASSGFDAFAQALEGYLSRVENPMGSLCAQEALRVIRQSLPQALANGRDLDARARMGWGDTLAGVSLATNAVVIPHVISMVTGARYGIPHGRAIAAVIVPCLRHSRAGAVPKLACIARLLGCAENRSDDWLADWAIAEVERFISELGLRRSLAEWGVPASDFPGIAAEVLEVFGVRVTMDPVPTDAAGLIRILEAAAEKG
jgi:alcohol dehydrogenase class IV